MKKRFKLALIILFILPTAIFAKERMAVGINYPGISFKYILSESFAAEGKYQTTGDISIVGARGYYDFYKTSPVRGFAGIEGDYILFKGEDSKGTGLAAGLFAGGEYRFLKKMGIQMDIGPVFIDLKDDSTSLTVSGMDIVLNIGFNYYF